MVAPDPLNPPEPTPYDPEQPITPQSPDDYSPPGPPLLTIDEAWVKAQEQAAQATAQA